MHRIWSGGPTLALLFLAAAHDVHAEAPLLALPGVDWIAPSEDVVLPTNTVLFANVRPGDVAEDRIRSSG